MLLSSLDQKRFHRMVQFIKECIGKGKSDQRIKLMFQLSDEDLATVKKAISQQDGEKEAA